MPRLDNEQKPAQEIKLNYPTCRVHTGRSLVAIAVKAVEGDNEIYLGDALICDFSWRNESGGYRQTCGIVMKWRWGKRGRPDWITESMLADLAMKGPGYRSRYAFFVEAPAAVVPPHPLERKDALGADGYQPEPQEFPL